MSLRKYVMLTGYSTSSMAIISILVLMSLVFSVSPLFAHAVLVASEPRDGAVLTVTPREVVLRFNVRIEKPVTQASLLNERGRKVPLKVLTDKSKEHPDRLVISIPPLQPGTYRLQYLVLAADGHASPGMVRFSVKAVAN